MADRIVPNVNIFLHYYNSHGGSKEYQNKRQFYSSNTNKDYMNYILTGINDTKKFDYLSYMNNKDKSAGVFGKNGLLTSDERKEIRQALRKTKSVIWDMVISFEEKFGKSWCDSYEQAYNLIKSELPKFFKSVGLNPNNITWFAGLHENTDNRHIHISFFENSPQRIRPNKKGKRYSNGKLSLNKINELKANIELSATDFKAREILTRKKLNDKMKESLMTNVGYILKNKLLSLANEFPKNGHTYYDCENMKSLKPKIDSITNYILSKDYQAKTLKEDFINLAKEKDEKFEAYCKRNRVKQPFTFEKKYMQDFYRRIGNVVIEQSKNLKAKDDERLKLNAKFKAQKIKQKKKLFNEIQECLYISQKVNYERIKTFQEFYNKLEELRYQSLIEQYQSQNEM